MNSVVKLSENLDIFDVSTVANFCDNEQQKLKDVTTELLAGVKNNEVASVGSLINSVVSIVRGLNPSEKIKPSWKDKFKKTIFGEKESWRSKIIGYTSPVASFIQEYESVQNQVMGITRELNEKRNRLDQNIIRFNKLIEQLLKYRESLSVYRQALALKKDEAEKMLGGEKDKEITQFIQHVERKELSLHQTETVALQAIPTIDKLNENNSLMILRMSDIIQNTIPMWELQISIALGLADQRAAAELTRLVTDVNGEMLTANARMLGELENEVRTEVERGAIDTSKIEEANRELINTLRNTVELNYEFSRTRNQAHKVLENCNSKLADALNEL